MRLDVFRALPRVTERRRTDREHAVRVRLGIERRAERPIQGAGIVYGFFLGALFWTAIIVGLVVLTGCATTPPLRDETFTARVCPAPLTSKGCAAWLDDVHQRAWDDSTPEVRR